MDFLRNNKRFSFVYGGKSFSELKCEKEVFEKGKELTTTYVFEDGLKLTNVAKYYPEFDAYEWVNWLENIGTENTKLITELWDCDVEIPMEEEGPRQWIPWFPDKTKVTKVYAPCGSNWSPEEFGSDPDRLEVNQFVNWLFAGDEKIFSETSGHSSGGKSAPFFNVHKDGKGFVAAIGWTGQWNCKMKREEKSLRLQSKVGDTAFVLYPGEKIRTSSIVIMHYEGYFFDGQNKWRRFLKKEISPVEKNGIIPPFCGGIWGGMRSSSVLKRLKKLDEYEIPVEYLWMDAGWYGEDTQPTPNEYEGDWPSHTGDWVISPFIHPNKMQDIVAELKRQNKKFLLWFEPERVKKHIRFAKEHPEYFIASKDAKNDNLLLYLGNEEALNYCIKTIGDLIEELSISCYRQDFNFEPAELWSSGDEKDRRGITEIKHIMGLYRFWDALLERFPGLLIDNCAGGGRRIDIETLKRSIPLWRSDAQCPANFPEEFSQAHHMNYALWMPYSGSGCGREATTYRFRSCMTGALTTNFTFSETDSYVDDDEFMKWFKGMCDEYIRVRKYFYADVYHLTKPSADISAWSAVQWDNPEDGDGLVQVFRREASPYSEAVFMLRKVLADKTYVFEDLDGGTFEISGSDLKKKGFSVRLEKQKTAKQYIYKVK